MSTFDKVAVDITVVLGTTSMPVHQVLRLGRGRLRGRRRQRPGQQPAGRQGTVAANGSRIAVNVSELLPRPPDMR